MPKTPSSDDNSFNAEETSRLTQKRKRGATLPHQENSLADEEYANLDHPEIPRIKRASRYLDTSTGRTERQQPMTEKRPRIERERTQNPQSASRRTSSTRGRPASQGNSGKGTTRIQREIDPDSTQHSTRTRIAREQTRPARPGPGSKPPTSMNQSQRTRVQSRFYIDDDDDALGDEKVTSRHRIPVETRLRRPIVYEPQNAQESYQRVQRRMSRRQQATFQQLRGLLRNRTVVITGAVTLVILILIPLIINSLNPSGTTGVITGSNGNQPEHNATPIAKVQPTNPHEVVITPPAGNYPAPPVLATSAYLLDADSGATFYASNPFMHIPPMSTTKMMTALITVQHDNLDQSVTINTPVANDLSAWLSPDSSVMGIKKGETYTIRQLLYGLFLVSGNDAAIVLADATAGSVPKFVAMMNQEAAQMGLHDTHFTNPHGLLANGHYSCAHDLAILAQQSLDNPILQPIDATKEYVIPATSQHAAHDMLNGNQFLFWYPGVMAGKTGWDGAANFVQVISAERDHRHLIGVVMHTVDWWTDMRDLLDYGFDDHTWISPREINANIHPIPYADEWSFFQSDTRTRTISLGNSGRYYVFTGYSISGPIMSYFDKNKGLQKFGYPIAQPVPSGTTGLSQHFEHDTIQCDLKTGNCRAS